MNQFSKWLLAVAVLGLAGCRMDILFEGEGRVTSTDGRVDCTEPCSKRTIAMTSVVLNAEPAPGYRFLGFISREASTWGVTYHAGTRNYWVSYGFTIQETEPTPGLPPLPTQIPFTQSARVTAIFWPEDDITQSLTAAGNVCVIDGSNRLQCWGYSEGHFPPDGALKLVTDADRFRQHNICVLYTDKVACRYEDYRDWLIPDDITQPLDVALSLSRLCILHVTAQGASAVHCSTSWGDRPVEVPELSNPSNLRVNDTGQFCVDDAGQTVCW